MSRLLDLGPRFSAAVAILIAASSCSSSGPGSAGAGAGGSLTGGNGGSVGSSAGRSGSGGTPDVAQVDGSVASSGGSGSGGTSGSAGNAGAASDTGGTGNNECLGHDIDLRATIVSGTVTVNGVTVGDPTSNGGGSLLLRNADDSALLTGTSPTGGSYSALVFPGTYDLYYAQSSAGPAVPINDLAKIQSGIVVGAAPVSLDIDVPGSKVSGTVTVNGAAISGAAKGAGSLRLVTAAGDATELTGTSTSGGSYSALVVPGSYDLYYGESSAGTSVPSNTSAKLQSGIVVGSAPLALDVNISATAVSGSFTINGATVASAIEQQGSLTLANAAGDQAPLGTYSAATGSYSGRVVPGTYDLYWSGSGADVPSNRSAKIQTGIVVGSSALVLDVDLLASTVSGTVTINGATDSALGNGISYLTLRGAAGDTAPITVSSAGSYSARVMPGTYDLYYGSKDAPLNVGARNVAAKIQSGIVVGASALTLNINVPVSTVSGNVAINGAAASAPGKNAFLLHLRNAAGDSALIASFPQGSYSASVVPGNYDLYYTKQGNGGLEIPSNIPAKIRSGIVVGSLPLSLDVDVPGSIVSGTITVNGVPNAGSSGDLGFVALLDAEGNASSLTSASSGMGTYSAFVVPGRYELYYLLYRGGPTIPSNSHFHLGCFIVP